MLFNYLIQVKEGDVFGINMIAFRRMNQMDLSGNIIGPEEHLPTLKVQLFKEDNVDSPVHTINMGVTSFFYLPSVVKDNTVSKHTQFKQCLYKHCI